MKGQIYTVRCTESIAREMMRYEGSLLVSKADQECDPKWTSPRLVEAYTTFLFTIQTGGVPNFARWKSFGVKVLSVNHKNLWV